MCMHFIFRSILPQRSALSYGASSNFPYPNARLGCWIGVYTGSTILKLVLLSALEWYGYLKDFVLIV